MLVQIEKPVKPGDVVIMARVDDPSGPIAIGLTIGILFFMTRTTICDNWFTLFFQVAVTMISISGITLLIDPLIPGHTQRANLLKPLFHNLSAYLLHHRD